MWYQRPELHPRFHELEVGDFVSFTIYSADWGNYLGSYRAVFLGTILESPIQGWAHFMSGEQYLVYNIRCIQDIEFLSLWKDRCC